MHRLLDAAVGEEVQVEQRVHERVVHARVQDDGQPVRARHDVLGHVEERLLQIATLGRDAAAAGVEDLQAARQRAELHLDGVADADPAPTDASILTAPGSRAPNRRSEMRATAGGDLERLVRALEIDALGFHPHREHARRSAVLLWTAVGIVRSSPCVRKRGGSTRTSRLRRAVTLPRPAPTSALPGDAARGRPPRREVVGELDLHARVPVLARHEVRLPGGRVGELLAHLEARQALEAEARPRRCATAPGSRCPRGARRNGGSRSGPAAPAPATCPSPSRRPRGHPPARARPPRARARAPLAPSAGRRRDRGRRRRRPPR